MTAPARERATTTRAARRAAIHNAALRRRMRRAATLRTTGATPAPLWLSTTQVAHLLHTPLPRVQQACRDGKLHAVRLGATWRVRADSIAGSAL